GSVTVGPFASQSTLNLRVVNEADTSCKLQLPSLYYECAGSSYCIPSSTSNCTSGDVINNFILNGVNGTSVNDQNTGCSSGGYADRTSLPPVSLYQASQNIAQVSTNYPIYQYCLIWIDYNDNFVFEANE